MLSQEVREIGGILFHDGRAVDLVQDTDGALKLIDSRRKNPVESIEVADRTYVPPSVSPPHFEIMTLPSGRSAYGSAAELFQKIHSLFVDHGFSGEAARPMTFFAIATWFLDVLPITPSLRIYGPQPEAHLALQLLALVVRHGLLLADINQAAFRQLPLFLQLTLLIEGKDPSVDALLSASTYPGGYVRVGDGFIDPCCATAIYEGNGVGTVSCDQPTLSVTLSPCQKKFPMLNDAGRRAIAADLQPRMLDYRFTHVARLPESDFDIPGLSPSLRIVARMLGACIFGAPELQASITAMLDHQHELIRSQHWINPRHALESLLVQCHRFPGPIRVGVGELATTANEIFADRKEATQLEAKAVGNLLRELGFVPTRDSGGYNLRLTEDLRRQIHIRARDYQIIEDQRDANCPLCAEEPVDGDPGENARVA